MPDKTRVIPRELVNAGDVVFREGEHGENAYLIEKGKIGIFKNVDGQDLLIRTLTANAVFGEMALIDKTPRSATAKALDPSILIPVHSERLQQKIAEADPFLRGMVPRLFAYVRDLSDNFRRVPTTIEQRLDCIRLDLLRLGETHFPGQSRDYQREIEGLLQQLTKIIVHFRSHS